MKDRVSLIALLLLSIVFIYLFPSLRRTFYVFLLIFYFFTRNDIVWFLFIFIRMQIPGGLFYYPYNVLIEIGSTGITFEYIFILVALIKIKLKHREISNVLYRDKLCFILLYSVFLLLVSCLYGMSLVTYHLVFDVFLAVVFFFLWFSLITDQATMIRFTNLLFFALFILFIWQIYDLFSLQKVAILLGIRKSLSYEFDKMANSEDLVRIFYAAWISFISFFISMYHLLQKRCVYYSHKYLLLVAIISFLSIFITATRGYILQYSFLFFCFIFLTKTKKSIRILVSILIIFLVINWAFPTFTGKLGMAFDRVATLVDLYKGDVTARGTLIRITERAPIVWGKYLESPIWGFGYSVTGYKYNDDHVGNFTLLLQGGIMGALIYLIVLLSVIIKLYHKSLGNKKKKQIYFIICTIISLLIAHSTSSTVFSYYFDPPIMAVFALLLVFTHLEIYPEDQTGNN